MLSSTGLLSPLPPQDKAVRSESVAADITVIDGTGEVGRFTSVAVDSGNRAHISYYDSTRDVLKYATNAGGEWILSTVDSDGDVGRSTSIAIDSADKAHISYYDSTDFDLKYATNAGGTWSVTEVDNADNVGLSTSIAIDSGGWIHISYYDSTHFDLKYATNIGGDWVSSTIDEYADVGGSTSIAVDSTDTVHISYGNITSGQLKYATNAGGDWVLSTVDSEADVSYGTSIAIDSADKVHISYFDTLCGDLKYATNVGGDWLLSTIDGYDDEEEEDKDVGLYSSIAIDQAGSIHISYHDEAALDLKYATNASGDWVVDQVDEYGDVGKWSSIAVDSTGGVHISYHDNDNAYLKYAKISSTLPIPEFFVDDTTPSTWQKVTFTGSVYDPDGNPLELTFDFGDGSYYFESLEPSSGETFTVTVDHAYVTAGTKIAMLYVSNGVTNASSSPLVMNVWLNYPPEEFVLPAINAYTNELVTVTVDTDDLDGDDLTYTWVWGDGAVDITYNIPTASHVYTESLDDVYTVYVDDGCGHNVTSTATVRVQVPFTLNLEVGWNMISIPLVNHGLKASTLGLQFGDMVTRWNPVTQTYDRNYIVGLSGSSGDFLIESSWGYWVTTGSSQSIVVGGDLPTTTQERNFTVPSGGGWVQVGLASMQTSLWASDIVSMCTEGTVLMIAKLSAATQTYSCYLAELDLFDFPLNPGDGLWLYVNASGMLAYGP